MFHYVAYGLGIRSSMALPELIEGSATAKADVDIDIGHIQLGAIDASVTHDDLKISVDATRMELPGVARCQVSNGKRIVVDPFPGADDALVRSMVLGLGISLLLQQRGLLVLHASAVAVNGWAVAFLGYSGDGKSTTAGALRRRGHGIVTDDVLAIGFDADDRPVVFPAYPELNLWPASIRSLGVDASTLKPVHMGAAKCAHRDAESFKSEALPLARIYVLGKSDQFEIDELPGAAACAQFIRHSSAASVLKLNGGFDYHFQQCGRLARRLGAWRLARPFSLDRLDELANLIENNLAQCSADSSAVVSA